MSVLAPVSVQMFSGHKVFNPDQRYFVARADGAIVSDAYFVSPRNPSFTAEMQWARAFLDGIVRAPFVVGVR